MQTLDNIYERKSIRKFKDEPVKKEDLKEILNAGLNAPSAKNKQNWHFVAISNKERIKKIKEIVVDKSEVILEELDDEQLSKKFQKFMSFYTFFDNAPSLILVYASKYHSVTGDILEKCGREEDLELFNAAQPGIQGIGAAMQNIFLAATALGYGGCWMSGPNFAIKEIEEYVALDLEGYHIVAMIPLGVPAEVKHPSPSKKDIDEKVTFID